MMERTRARLNVVVLGGTGVVGSALVRMMRMNENVSDGNERRIRLRMWMNSTTITRVSDEDDGRTSVNTIDRASQSMDDAIERCAKENENEATCVVDCTSSAEAAGAYARWLSRGWHVATCNKKANSGDLTYYRSCVEAANTRGNGKWFVEGTIGAGLPVVSTLRTLRATGDRLESVRGIFSGTMSFLFNTWDGTSSFAAIVGRAKSAGYTEPDPREDLNGLDVARKVVIAARECGMMISLSDVDVESMVPRELESCSADEFMARLAENDSAMAKRARVAAERGAVLRFVGAVDVVNQKASVSLAEFPNTHPFATLSGTDNVFEIQSARYGPTGKSTPMIIRGPGAGAEVTAAGVFGDIAQLAREL